MAQINISVDTTEKTVSVKVDDKKISDIHDIHVFTEKSGFFGVDIAQVEDLGDLKKITRLVASKEDGPKTIEKQLHPNKDLEYVSSINYLGQVCFSGGDGKLRKGDLHKFELVMDKYNPDFIAGLSEVLGQK